MKKSVLFCVVVMLFVNGIVMAMTPAPCYENYEPGDLVVATAADYAGNTAENPWSDNLMKSFLAEASVSKNWSLGKIPKVDNPRVVVVNYLAFNGETRQKLKSVQPEAIKVFDGSFKNEDIILETKRDRVEYFYQADIMPDMNLSEVLCGGLGVFKAYQATWFQFPQMWDLCQYEFVGRKVDGVQIPATACTRNGVSAFVVSLDERTKLYGMEDTKASLAEVKETLKNGQPANVVLPRLSINYAHNKNEEVGEEKFSFASDREVVELASWIEKSTFTLNEHGVSTHIDDSVAVGLFPKPSKGAVIFDEPFVLYVVSVENGDDVLVYKVRVISMWYPA